MPGYQTDYSPHAAGYAQALPSHALDGVRTRRILAFLLDYTIVALLVVAAAIVVFFLGILTLGLGWLLYPILGLVVALAYVGMTMGGSRQATLGMDFFSLRIMRDDGTRIDMVTAIVHACIFWAAHVALTPLLLAVSLLSGRKKLVQDILLGTTIVRSDR